tara:strand:- start:2293 stop:2538 length:246 start_codon:yes stop_codon:yes gene_type:complete
MKKKADIEEQVKKILLKVLKISDKEFKENIGAYNNPSWDSMNHLEILLSLEKNFNIKFSQNEISKLDSFTNIIKIIERKKN